MLLALLLIQDPAALVERLRSDDIEIRQRAEADLGRLGPAAEPVLDAAARDADPEVASRAQVLLMDVVAPHRREVAREIAHLAAHVRFAAASRTPTATIAAAVAVRALDREHPLATTDGWSALIARVDSMAPGARIDGSPEGLLGPVRYPSRERWESIRGELRALSERAYERTCAVCVWRRLDSFKVGLSLENVRVEAILDQLKGLGDVRLVMDTMDVQLERAVTVQAKDVTLAEAFERVLAPFGLAARVAEGGVVMVVPRPAE